MADIRTVTTVTGTAQPLLDTDNERTGATTTDPAVGARAADGGVKVDPRTGAVSQRGPVGEELRSVTVVADRPVFVRVPAESVKRRLVGEDLAEEESLVLYLAGDRVPPEHRELPTVPAVHRAGVWVPGEEPARRKR